MSEETFSLYFKSKKNIKAEKEHIYMGRHTFYTRSELFAFRCNTSVILEKHAI